MTDILTMLAEMRDGQTVIDINRKFNEVHEGVLATLGTGELTIKIKMKPAEVAIGGKVIRMEISHDVKMKVPEIKQGASVFFVTHEGDLARSNPAQDQMFEEAAIRG